MQININNKTQEKEIGEDGGKKPLSSELRQDLVTGDWVVIATARAKRPEDFAKEPQAAMEANDVANCLFEDPVASGQEKDVLIYHRSDGEWTLRVFPNKFPAFSNARPVKPCEEGPYFSMPAVGYHEVIVTRDHFRHLPQLEVPEVAEVVDSFQERYLTLMSKKSVKYISIFHNYGREAGASIAHPHSQLIAMPVLSPYLEGELSGAERYRKANRECVYCAMLGWELEKRERIVFENEDFVAFCPFASRAAFEVWVLPKKHSPYFERITDEGKISFAQVLKNALLAVRSALNDAPYNFYIHTAPCDGKDYPHYHWHVEILPHTATWAGFELETGIEISTIQPEVAAEYLRKQL